MIAAALACRGLAEVGAAAAVVRRGVANAAARLVACGPDRPPQHVPGRNPDIYPPHDSPDQDQPPGSPNPDLYPPDVGTPRRDPDVVPPLYPSPDVFPPIDDNPDMPEPNVPGRGPFMESRDSPKLPRALPVLVIRGNATLLARGGTATLLLNTDGGIAWLDTQRGYARGFASGGAFGEKPGRSMSAEEQEAANRTRAATEGVQKQGDEVQGDEVPTKVSDTGDVPEMTGGGQRMSPKVGPKASPGTPLDKPVEEPKPGFPA